MDAVEEIKSRLAIEDVVGEYVQLKRSGRNFKGLSPFTSERTPSFMVSPEKQIWHDFSSGKGGNMFSFVMEMEGLDFKGALELLARKAGVDLEQYRTGRTSSNTKVKERLYDVLLEAARFYYQQLRQPQNQAAYDYVRKKRQFTEQTVTEWRLGYSPTSGRALIDFLKGKDFTDKEIQGAGLSARAYRGGVQDMFRGRIMIPLQDPQGRVIGFTARLLADQKNAPKYINTPQTLLYDKSRHVYGLHLAKEAIRKSKFVVLVEGNLDVIASHQAGVRQVVATAGTALTEPNLKALSRFTGDIRLSFDADQAGINATERAIPIASKVGVSLSIITIPSGKDPDELIKQSGVEIWTQIIGQSKYALDWLMERYQNLLDVQSAQGKKQFSDVLLPIVRQLQDSVEQDHYMRKITEVLGVGREALDTKLAQSGETPRRQMRKRTTPANPAQLDRARVELMKTQDHLLALLLLHPKLRERATILTTDMLATDQARQLLTFLREHPDFAGQPEQVAKLKDLGDYVKILALQHEELYQGVETLELDYEVTRLQARLIEQYIKHEKQTLVAQLDTADEQQTRELLVRVKDLDTLLKQTQGRA